MVVSSVTHSRATRASRAANPLTQVNLNHSQTAPARESRCCSITTIPSVPVETSCSGPCRVLRARDGQGYRCVVYDHLPSGFDRVSVAAVIRSTHVIAGLSLCRGRCWVIACTYFTALQSYNRFKSSVLSCSRNRTCFPLVPSHLRKNSASPAATLLSLKHPSNLLWAFSGRQ